MRPIVQEREETGCQTSFIQHKDDNYFVINIYALHNAHLIHRILPRSLLKPKLLHSDCEASHHQIATTLRESRNGRRKAAAERRAAKASHSKQTTSRKRMRPNSGRAALIPVSTEDEVNCDEGPYGELPEAPDISEDEYQENQAWSEEGDCSEDDTIAQWVQSRRSRHVNYTEFL